MNLDERLAKMKESQRKSDDLLLSLCESLEKTNEEQDVLSSKIDDLLRLQNDSHYTIGGVIREKLEDLEERNDIFREQLESSTTMVSEGLQKKLAAIEEKVSESQRVISNMATEVSLLKIGVGLMKNTITERDSEKVDVHRANEGISVEKEIVECATTEESEEDSAELSATDKQETKNSAEVPPSIGKKELTDEEKKIQVTETVLERKLGDEYKWMKDKVVIVSGGVRMENGEMIQLTHFLYLAKNRPNHLFPEEKFEVECYKCEMKTVFNPHLLGPNTLPCHNCQIGIVLGDPPANCRYCRNDCGHINIVPSDILPSFPLKCFTCNKVTHSYSATPIDSSQIRHLKRVEITDRQRLESTFKYSHLEWIEKRITFLDDSTFLYDSGEVEDIAKLNLVFNAPWALFPDEFEVDCHSCGKILSLENAEKDLFTIICPHCSKTTVAAPVRYSDKIFRMAKFGCGHHAEVREDNVNKRCPVCRHRKLVPLSKKIVRVMWRKGASIEMTWNPYWKQEANELSEKK